MVCGLNMFLIGTISISILNAESWDTFRLSTEPNRKAASVSVATHPSFIALLTLTLLFEVPVYYASVHLVQFDDVTITAI
jgi:hypothetical protein